MYLQFKYGAAGENFEAGAGGTDISPLDNVCRLLGSGCMEWCQDARLHCTDLFANQRISSQSIWQTFRSIFAAPNTALIDPTVLLNVKSMGITDCYELATDMVIAATRHTHVYAIADFFMRLLPLLILIIMGWIVLKKFLLFVWGKYHVPRLRTELAFFSPSTCLATAARRALNRERTALRRLYFFRLVSPSNMVPKNYPILVVRVSSRVGEEPATQTPFRVLLAPARIFRRFRKTDNPEDMLSRRLLFQKTMSSRATRLVNYHRQRLEFDLVIKTFLPIERTKRLHHLPDKPVKKKSPNERASSPKPIAVTKSDTAVPKAKKELERRSRLRIGHADHGGKIRKVERSALAKPSCKATPFSKAGGGKASSEQFQLLVDRKVSFSQEDLKAFCHVGTPHRSESFTDVIVDKKLSQAAAQRKASLSKIGDGIMDREGPNTVQKKKSMTDIHGLLSGALTTRSHTNGFGETHKAPIKRMLTYDQIKPSCIKKGNQARSNKRQSVSFQSPDLVRGTNSDSGNASSCHSIMSQSASPVRKSPPLSPGRKFLTRSPTIASIKLSRSNQRSSSVSSSSGSLSSKQRIEFPRSSVLFKSSHDMGRRESPSPPPRQGARSSRHSAQLFKSSSASQVFSSPNKTQKSTSPSPSPRERNVSMRSPLISKSTSSIKRARSPSSASKRSIDSRRPSLTAITAGTIRKSPSPKPVGSNLSRCPSTLNLRSSTLTHDTSMPNTARKPTLGSRRSSPLNFNPIQEPSLPNAAPKQGLGPRRPSQLSFQPLNSSQEPAPQNTHPQLGIGLKRPSATSFHPSSSTQEQSTLKHSSGSRRELVSPRPTGSATARRLSMLSYSPIQESPPRAFTSDQARRSTLPHSARKSPSPSPTLKQGISSVRSAASIEQSAHTTGSLVTDSIQTTALQQLEAVDTQDSHGKLMQKRSEQLLQTTVRTKRSTSAAPLTKKSSHTVIPSAKRQLNVPKKAAAGNSGPAPISPTSTSSYSSDFTAESSSASLSSVSRSSIKRSPSTASCNKPIPSTAMTQSTTDEDLTPTDRESPPIATPPPYDHGVASNETNQSTNKRTLLKKPPSQHAIKTVPKPSSTAKNTLQKPKK